MSKLWENFVYKFFQYAPSSVVSLMFLPCGLVFGYTISSFVIERNSNVGVIAYGPIILGGCWGLVAAIAMFMMKFMKGRIIFWHIHILLAAGAFHILASCFFFATNVADVGSFISYLAHALTFLAGLSYLHSIPGRKTRSIFLSASLSFYLLGIASAVSLICKRYSKEIINNPNAADGQSIEGIYVDFAGVYLSIAVVCGAILIGLKVLNFFGTVDCENCIDNEFRIANSNGSIFDKRQELIKRIRFFYITKNQQWNVTFVLIFTEAVHYAMFIYFVFWFSMNTAVQIATVNGIDLIFWIIFVGSIVSTASLAFVSPKILFVGNQLCMIILTVISMIIFTSVESHVNIWLILFFFGLSFSNLKIAMVEVSHFCYTELIIYGMYVLKLISTSVVYYYFVSNGKNSYFYSTDESTVMAQGFVFIIITALLALVVGMKVPRTFRKSLFEIQYGLLGIIFEKHQIEQLNVQCLNDGTIPTISRSDVH